MSSKKTGNDHGIPVVDLAVSIPRTTAYFYDDVHLTIAGARLAAKELADFLWPLLQEQFSFGQEARKR